MLKQQARRKAMASENHPERLSVKAKRDRFSFKMKKAPETPTPGAPAAETDHTTEA